MIAKTINPVAREGLLSTLLLEIVGACIGGIIATLLTTAKPTLMAATPSILGIIVAVIGTIVAVFGWTRVAGRATY